MQKEVKVLSGQTIFDMSLFCYNDASLVYNLMSENSLITNLNMDLTGYTLLYTPIEKIKYDALMASPRKNKRYIVSTPEGVFSFDIEKVKYVEENWVLHLLPSSTEFYNTEKIYKYVNYINFNEAKQLN
jgi:hypothetical protein